MTAIRPSGPGEPGPRDSREQLQRMSRALEGVFLAQLFQALRATVPESGLGTAAGQDLFTAMLDERLAELAAQRMRGGVGDALYRQLSRRLEPPATGSPHGPSASAAPPAR